MEPKSVPSTQEPKRSWDYEKILKDSRVKPARTRTSYSNKDLLAVIAKRQRIQLPPAAALADRRATLLRTMLEAAQAGRWV